MELLIPVFMLLIGITLSIFWMVVAWRFLRAHETLANEAYEIRALLKNLAKEHLVGQRLAADNAGGE